MEYESDRALNDPKIEEARRAAITYFDKNFDLKFETQDPNWAQPAPQPHLPAVGIEEAQGFWINGGKTGSKKDEQIEAPRNFDHDLPSLAKDGPTDLPKGEWAETKLTPAEIEERMKAHDFTFPELLPTLAYYSPAGNLEISVDEFNKGVNIGPNNEPVYRRVFPEDKMA